jgi:hypothetical protein
VKNVSSASQTVNLTTGWNIFSVNVNPVETDMASVFQLLRSSSSIVKILDENGYSYENWGIYGGWTNKIGNLKLTEGYKAKIKQNCQLVVDGTPAGYPFKIPLKAGWNIIGCPQNKEIDAKSVVQQLIDRGTLIKIQNENGKSLEDWGIFGSWTNNIGNFVPGEGYKLKARAIDTLTIYESYGKSAVAFLTESSPTSHFITVSEGNGTDHMNINLVNLPVNALHIGDEIAVYDGKTCVGAVSLLSWHLANQTVSIPVSAADELDELGFTEGNPFTIKLWEDTDGKEFTVLPEIIKGTSTFLKNETTIASLEKYATGFTDLQLSHDVNIKCYPNPFSDEISIEIFITESSGLSIDIIAQDGRLIKQLVKKIQCSEGTQMFKWNGSNNQNNKVASGIYYLRIRTDNKELHHKIVFNK